MVDISNDKALYSIGIASEMLGVHPRTLRIYEDEGLIKPQRKGGRRFFSKDDIKWIECIRGLIHEENISIPGIKKLLEYAPCWKIRGCNQQEKCTVSYCKNRKCWDTTQKICQQSYKCCED